MPKLSLTILAAFALATPIAGIGQQYHVVPATPAEVAGLLSDRARPLIIEDDGSYGIAEIGLPAGSGGVRALARDGQDYLWVPQVPLSIGDDLVAGQADVVRFDGDELSLAFHGAAYGLMRGQAINALTVDADSRLLLALSLPLMVDGTLVVPADILMADQGSLTLHQPALALLPKPGTLQALTTGESGELALIVNQPFQLAEQMATGITLLSINDSALIVMRDFGDIFPAVHAMRLIGATASFEPLLDSLFSDRFELP